MKYPFFASFIILLLVIRHAIRRSNHLAAKEEQSFWEREQEANQVRRKPLDDLEFVRIPMDTLPTNTLPEDETVQDCISTLLHLSDEKIVNLTGYTNTDLKLKYGVANLPVLTAYDNNYTLLVQTLQKWSDYLWEKGFTEEAIAICTYMVSIRADVGAAYRRLAKYYKNHGQSDRIRELISVVETLSSASKNSILRSLNEEL